MIFTFTTKTCSIVMAFWCPQYSWKRIFFLLVLAYAPQYYWLITFTGFIHKHEVWVWLAVFIDSRSFIWYTFLRLCFSYFSELCIILGLRSIHLRNDLTNLGKSHYCHSSSSLTRSALIPGNLSRVSLTYHLISLNLFIVSRACTLTINFA